MPSRDPARLTKVKVSLPFNLGSAEWEADPTERRAAWSIYVELATRIAVQPLGENEGLDREAINSLYSLFEVTRATLREAGPDVGASRDSVGGIAIAVLNRGLRPFLQKWHPELQAWEARREEGQSLYEHERGMGSTCGVPAGPGRATATVEAVRGRTGLDCRRQTRLAVTDLALPGGSLLMICGCPGPPTGRTRREDGIDGRACLPAFCPRTPEIREE